MQLGKDEFFQQLFRLYGLTVAEEYWSQTLVEHCVEHTQLEQSVTDSSFSFHHVGKALAGLSGKYVKDILRAAPFYAQHHSTRSTPTASKATSAVAARAV
jgi:hypothetical protein